MTRTTIPKLHRASGCNRLIWCRERDVNLRLICCLTFDRFRSQWRGLECESGRTPAGKTTMPEDPNRQRVLNFLDVFYSGDVEAALARCSDDIDFVTHAPIDLLPHLGHRHGKAEVGAWMGRHEVPFLVAEQDRVAATIRVFFRKRVNGRIVQFDLAAFYTLADGRLVKIHEIIDSFDLVQQILERDIAAEINANTAKTPQA